MSLHRRVVAGIVAMASLLVVGNVVLARIVERYLLDRLDQQLVDVSSRPVFRGGRGSPQIIEADQTLSEYFIAIGDPSSGAMVRLTSAIADADQSPPVLDSERILQNVAEDRPYTAKSMDGRGEWRLAAVADRRHGVTVVGISLDDVRSTIDRIRLVQVGATLAVLAALGMVSWWMLRLGVRPIEAMARAADAIAGGDLSHRIEHPRESTEAGRMGAAFNAMLDRIQESFRAREASEERVRRFAADASHELRTPLTSIQGYAELWRAGGLEDEGRLADAMRRMEQEAQRMAALVEDLLLLARLDQRPQVERTAVRLDEIAADGVRDAMAVEPDRPIEIDAAEVSVEGDELQLRQIVANLLGNARAHTPPATPVRVTVAAADGHARLEVADEGPGMSPEVAAKAFDRFFRADPARTRAQGGSGLGLSIVAAVAEAHGGRASVDSTVREGTRFVVELPLSG